ncbi:hypothetical protein DFH06DRAFT_1284884 [Mycena polygramma]|nr:hypothetical protein DFH06DRAFT_1284884 [Mycena polygramma]
MNAMQSQQMLDIIVGLALTCRLGDKLLEAGKLEAAKTTYLQEARKIVGPQFRLPSVAGEDEGGVVSSVYIALELKKIANLMGCCLGMAKCLIREKKTEMALAWLEEISALHRCTYPVAEHPLYDWIDLNLNISEVKVFRAQAFCLASDIFLSLGNTATGTTRRHTAGDVLHPLTPELEAFIDYERLFVLYQSRHPDPQATLKDDAISPGLQVRGSWKRLDIQKPGGLIGGRESFASFIWNSCFYVAGGRRAIEGPWYRDFWVLDLNLCEAWRQLPDYPRASGAFMGWNMLVHDDTAILFTGRPAVDVFDLRTETWGSFMTTYTPTPADLQAGVKNGWPYPKQMLSGATMQIVHNKLYVFGGEHGTTSIGCNLFMELDLSTRKWRRLTGYVRAPEYGDYSCPGPRKSASSWVSMDKTRFFLLFGHADRQGAKLQNELHGASKAFDYGDMWSWSIAEERWRRERMAGNPPCARTEMACTYNEKLGRTIVFGGYSPRLMSIVMEPTPKQFEFSYFADTFVYDMTPAETIGTPDPEPTLFAPKWKQVLSHGFPTYRCQAQLACDPATGRTYLFGGWANNQYIPTRTQLLSRSFADLHELRLDMPEGHFDEVDFAEEARSARAGPWQRCFTCGAAGPWRKCGGSCKGRAFFCGSPCLKEGWKEHKEMHKCRKS